VLKSSKKLQTILNDEAIATAGRSQIVARNALKTASAINDTRIVDQLEKLTGVTVMKRKSTT
jgi:hypothetical protein